MFVKQQKMKEVPEYQYWRVALPDQCLNFGPVGANRTTLEVTLEIHSILKFPLRIIWNLLHPNVNSVGYRKQMFFSFLSFPTLGLRNENNPSVNIQRLFTNFNLHSYHENKTRHSGIPVFKSTIVYNRRKKAVYEIGKRPLWSEWKFCSKLKSKDALCRNSELKGIRRWWP